jgi:CRP-like cAMP-binding protein
MIAREKDNLGPTDQSLLSSLPQHFLTQLFGRATTMRLKADQVLFLVGETGDSCYRVDDGLLKVTMVSRTVEGTHSRFSRPGRNRW